MPAEQLNIKIKLDIDELNSNVRKAKTQLKQVADTAEHSIPKITTESNKASRALKDVSEEGGKLKRTLNDIGNKAKTSLSGIVGEGNKLTTLFQRLGIAGRAANAGMSVDDTNASLEEMKGTMETIASIDIFGALSTQASKFARIIDGIKIKKSMKTDLKALCDYYTKTIRMEMADHQLAYEEGYLDDDEAREWGDAIVDKVKKAQRAYKQATDQMKAATKAVRMEVSKLTSTFITLTTAIVGVVLPINALSVSKMAAEIDVAAQRAGFSAQAYQEWSYVLDRAGVEAGELVEVMKTLTESQVDVIGGSKDMIAAYEQLGISAAEVASLNQQQLWERTIAALQNMENATMRNAVAYQIFGEDAAKLTTVFNMNNQQTQSLISTYNALGATMSADLIKKSNQLQAAVVSLKAAWQGLRNTLAQAVIPAVVAVVNVLTKAIIIVNTFLQVIFGLDLSPAINNMNAGFSAGSGAADDYADSVGGAAGALEKLRRATMGFDELNKLPGQDSGSGGGSGGSGGSFGGGGGISMPTTSVFDEATNDLVAFREKVMDFMEKWKTQLQIVAGALGGLTIAGLLGSFGNLIGLGDEFLGIISSIKQTAGAVITITLQYMAVNEFLDNYLDGEGFKNWIYAALSTALGSLILWSMWGATGLAIGLGITAFVSLDAIFENGGITNIESGVVALTGIATAIAAISFAWKGLGMSAIIANIGAFIALLKEGNSIGSVLAATFPKVAGVVASIGTAFSSATGYISGAVKAVGTFLGSLSGSTVAIAVAAIAAIASTAYYLYENWETVVGVVKRFFELSIAPKLEEIKQRWEEIKTALSGMGEAFMNAIPEGARQLLIQVGDWLANLVKQVKDFIEQTSLLSVVATVFEFVGGIIAGVVGAVVAPAIAAITELITGLITFITGVVQIISGLVSGLINLIVGLITGDFAAVVDSVKLIWDGIVNLFKGGYEATIGVVVSFVQGIIDWFVSLWDELVGHSIVPDMINAIVEWFKGMPAKVFAAVAEFVSGVLTRVKGLWTDITTWFKSNVEPKFQKSYWMTKFDTIRQAASEKLEAAKQLFTSIWSSITSWFSSSVAPKFTSTYWATKFNSIKDGAKTVLNNLIGIIEKAANSIVGKVNSISFTAPSWVPGYGGKTIGFNLKTISIPRLANGGITTGSTIANIGEKGTEMVLPLTGTQGSAWMDMLADKIASRNQTPSKIVLSVDGRELGWAAINNINGITAQTGGLQLVL